jgi:diacylglycerol kinase
VKKSFADAFRGVLSCVKTERNFRFHLAAAFYVVIAAAVTGLSAAEWALALLCIAAVTGAELFNTAIEKLCDTLQPDWHPGIGRVKDIAAGAVLMFAAVSAVVGGIIFFNTEKLSKIAGFASAHTALAVLILASVPLAGFLIFRRYGNDKKDSHDHNRRPSERR